RDGSVASASNGGSDLPDAGVISCVVKAFSGLAFPEPEGGIITVTYPIMFSPDGGNMPPVRVGPPTWPSEAISVAHRKGDDAWMTQGEDTLDKLRQAARDGVDSRRRHEALIRGLLGRGRFAEALGAARRFADLDPDLPRARELLAEAAAAQGDRELARTALDAQVELSPTNGDLHARVARAFEAAGDERRACAHFRSALELRPGSDEAQYEALRCQARLGDRDGALRAAAAVEKPGKLLQQL